MNNFDLQRLPDHPWWERLIGIAFIIIGVIGVIYSVQSTFFSVIYLGALATAFGVLEFLQSFKERSWAQLALHMAIGALYAFSGVYLIKNPGFSAISLTLFMAIMLMASGISRMIITFFEHIQYKGLVFLSGLISFILGVLIWRQWPVSGLWVIGMFFGIDFITNGIMLLMLSTKRHTH